MGMVYSVKAPPQVRCDALHACYLNPNSMREMTCRCISLVPS